MLFSHPQLGGLKEGDFIVELSGIDVKWYTQHQLSKLIQNARRSLELKVITPIDRNYLKVNYSLISFIHWNNSKLRLTFNGFLSFC